MKSNHHSDREVARRKCSVVFAVRVFSFLGLICVLINFAHAAQESSDGGPCLAPRSSPYALIGGLAKQITEKLPQENFASGSGDLNEPSNHRYSSSSQADYSIDSADGAGPARLGDQQLKNAEGNKTEPVYFGDATGSRVLPPTRREQIAPLDIRLPNFIVSQQGGQRELFLPNLASVDQETLRQAARSLADSGWRIGNPIRIVSTGSPSGVDQRRAQRLFAQALAEEVKNRLGPQARAAAQATAQRAAEWIDGLRTSPQAASGESSVSGSLVSIAAAAAASAAEAFGKIAFFDSLNVSIGRRSLGVGVQTGDGWRFSASQGRPSELGQRNRSVGLAYNKCFRSDLSEVKCEK